VPRSTWLTSSKALLMCAMLAAALPARAELLQVDLTVLGMD
jgi:hypothetical protein